MASSESSQCGEGSSKREEEGLGPLGDKDAPQVLQDAFPRDELDKLVPFLLRKYQKKEQVTLEEMVQVVGRDYHEYFPLIFRELCECMCLSFGIEMRDAGPPDNTYELVPVLGLTYSGMLDDDAQILPKADLLIFILNTISMQGSRVGEEDLRELLRDFEVLGERELIAIGEPWEFVTGDLVREEYLEYRQVPNSEPARYEFLWGPRAQAETTKLKVFQHVFRLDRTDPRSYPHLYEQAVRREKGAVGAPEGQDA